MHHRWLLRKTDAARLLLQTRRCFSTATYTDVAIVGAGHNGLVAAALLAKAGLKACCA